MKEQQIKKVRKQRRLNRTRRKIIGVARIKNKPRLSVFRSNVHFYAQIIDDVKGVTLAGVSESEIKDKLNRVEKASELGAILAKKAKDLGIKEVIFDKGAYKYHGRVKSFAEGARKGGLIF